MSLGLSPPCPPGLQCQSSMSSSVSSSKSLTDKSAQIGDLAAGLLAEATAVSQDGELHRLIDQYLDDDKTTDRKERTRIRNFLYLAQVEHSEALVIRALKKFRADSKQRNKKLQVFVSKQGGVPRSMLYWLDMAKKGSTQPSAVSNQLRPQ